MSEQLKIKLHPGQAEVFKSKKRFRVLVSGRRFGKTQMAATEIIRQCQRPRCLIWYVAPTYQIARDTFWPRFKEMMPRRWVRHTHDTRMEMTLINATRIALKGADDFDRLRGVGLDFVVLDETQDIHPDAWNEVLRPTLADTGGRALMIGTPKIGSLLHELWQRGQDERYVEWQSWTFRTIDSPFIPQAEIDQAMEDMDERTFRQEMLGEWVASSGRVYHAFDRQKHVKKIDFNPRLPIWVGVDFNINPMSAAILQFNKESGKLFQVSEISRINSNTLDMVNAIEARYWRYMDQITIYPDPSGASRQHARGESDLDIFRERGFNSIRYHKKAPPIADRTNAVNRLFMNAKGESRFFLDENCRSSIQSFEQTVYKDNSREINKRLSTEHMADAIGYAVEYEFPLSRGVLVGVSL